MANMEVKALQFINSAGLTVTVNVDFSASVSVLKAQLAVTDLLGIPAEHQRIICFGEEWENSKTVGSYKPPTHHAIPVLDRVKDSNEVAIKVSVDYHRDHSGDKSGHIEVTISDIQTLGELMIHIEEVWAIPRTDQHWRIDWESSVVVSPQTSFLAYNLGQIAVCLTVITPEQEDEQMREYRERGFLDYSEFAPLEWAAESMLDYFDQYYDHTLKQLWEQDRTKAMAILRKLSLQYEERMSDPEERPGRLEKHEKCIARATMDRRMEQRQVEQEWEEEEWEEEEQLLMLAEDGHVSAP